LLLFRIHWVHYHFNHGDHGDWPSLSNSPPISYERFKSLKARFENDRNDTETEGSQSAYNSPDWSIGLWHVCRQRVRNNENEENIACQRSITYKCSETVPEGHLFTLINSKEKEVCLPFIQTTRTMLLLGISLHCLSQLAVMLEKPGSMRNSYTVWLTFGIATLFAGLLNLFGIVYYAVNMHIKVKLPEAYRTFADTFTFTMFGISSSVTIFVAIGCIARAVYLRHYKEKREKQKAIRKQTVAERPSVKGTMISDLRFLAPPSLPRRGSSQLSKKSVILSASALQKYTLALLEPPPYSFMMDTEVVSAMYNRRDKDNPASEAFQSNDPQNDQAPYRQNTEESLQTVSDTNGSFSNQVFDTDNEVVSETDPKETHVHFRTDSQGFDAVSIIDTLESDV